MLTTKDRIKLVPTQISTSQYWFDSKGYKWIVIRPMSRNRRLWEVMQQTPTQDNFFRMTSHEISTRINEYNNIPMSSISIQFDTSGNKIVEIPDSILKSGKYNESETINQLRQMTSLGGQITSLVPVGNEHTTSITFSRSVMITDLLSALYKIFVGENVEFNENHVKVFCTSTEYWVLKNFIKP